MIRLGGDLSNARKLRALLYDQVLLVSDGRCEYPADANQLAATSGLRTCDTRMAEMAHITSTGMGGSVGRQYLGNVMAACRTHARVTDLLPPPGGGVEELHSELVKVLPDATLPAASAPLRQRYYPGMQAALHSWLAQLRYSRGWDVDA